MLYLKSASLACVAALTAVSVFHATAFAEPDRSGMLAQYEDVGQQNLEFAPAVLMPAAEAELLDQQFTNNSTDQGDLWDRIRKGFAIQELNNPLVAIIVSGTARVLRACSALHNAPLVTCSM